MTKGPLAPQFSAFPFLFQLAAAAIQQGPRTELRSPAVDAALSAASWIVPTTLSLIDHLQAALSRPFTSHSASTPTLVTSCALLYASFPTATLFNFLPFFPAAFPRRLSSRASTFAKSQRGPVTVSFSLNNLPATQHQTISIHSPTETATMSRIQIPLDALTSRFNLGDRFSSIRSSSLSSRFANLRPVSEFLDIKRVSKPQNFAEVQSRVNYNLGYFSSNYAIVFVMLCIYALLTNPWLLFDIIFVVLGMYLIGKLNGQDLEIGQTRLTTSQLYTGLYVIAIPIGLISSPFSTIMWLIGASGVVILGHASLLDKPLEEAFSGEAV